MTKNTYDSLNRLAKVEEPGGKTTAYTFDKAGNRLTETAMTGTNSATTSYTYNEQNRLVSTTKQSGSQTITEKYTYDNNGNTTAKTTETTKPVDPAVTGNFKLYKAGQGTESTVTNYKFDVWNQLIKTVTGQKTVTYSYNAEGYRVAKTENGQKTNYLYEGDKVILETDSAGNQTAKNIYGINLLTRTAGSDTMNYMYNGHGDVTALLKPDGTTAGTYYYDAFGNILSQTGTANNSITYAGYQYDKETDLYYLNARYYDSKIARFISEDTYTGNASDPLSLNLYTYCANNPITYSDPTGHVAAGDQNRSTVAQGLIIVYSNQYSDAKKVYDNPNASVDAKKSAKAEMNAAASAAAVVRKDDDAGMYDSYGQRALINGSELTSALKDGKITDDEWKRINTLSDVTLGVGVHGQENSYADKNGDKIADRDKAGIIIKQEESGYGKIVVPELYMYSTYGSGKLKDSNNISNVTGVNINNKTQSQYENGNNINNCTLTSITKILEYYQKLGNMGIPLNDQDIYDEVKNIAKDKYGYSDEKGVPESVAIKLQNGSILTDSWKGLAGYYHGKGNDLFTVNANLTIKNQVDKGNPFMLNIVSGTYVSHTITGVGYQDYTISNSNKNIMLIEVYDNYSNTARYIDFNRFNYYVFTVTVVTPPPKAYITN